MVKNNKTQVCIACENKDVVFKPLNQDLKIYCCQNCLLEWRASYSVLNKGEKFYAEGYFSQRGAITRGYPNYEMFYDSFQKYFSSRADLLNKYAAGRGRLIDVGCGLGIFLNEARKRGFQVTGVDLSKEAARKTWERYKITVEHGSFENLTIADQSSDIITCFQTLEHMNDPRRFFRKAYKVLKPEGVLLITTPNSDCFWKKILRQYWFSYRHEEHLFFWNKKALELAFRKVGFKKIKFFSDDWRWYSLLQLEALLRAYSGGGGGLLKKSIPRSWLFRWIKIPFPIGSIGVLASK